MALCSYKADNEIIIVITISTKAHCGNHSCACRGTLWSTERRAVAPPPMQVIHMRCRTIIIKHASLEDDEFACIYATRHGASLCSPLPYSNVYIEIFSRPYILRAAPQKNTEQMDTMLISRMYMYVHRVYAISFIVRPKLAQKQQPPSHYTTLLITHWQK